MDPVIFEFIGGLLVGAFVGLMVILRIKHPPAELMPMLAVRTSRSASSNRRRRTSPPVGRGQTTVAIARTGRKAKNKAPNSKAAITQTPEILPTATVSFDTCPSCGLQAPGSLLTEHYLGSPSHRNGPPKIVEADPDVVQAAVEAEEEDSRQSVRSLLQMLVPPRAFGRRHAYKTVSPISPMIQNRDPALGRTNGL